MVKLTDDLQANFPFISVVLYGGVEYVGIIANQDQHVTTMYNYELLRTPAEKLAFLELGETYWWESNRTIPINIFLKSEIAAFRHAMMTLNSKDVTVLLGPTVNLNTIANKRIKRKIIQVVRPK